MNKKSFFFAAMSGILLALAFPMFNLEFIAWIGLVPLFFSIKGKGPLHSLYLGIVSGLAFYLILLYWIPIPITVYGKLPLPIGILLLFILALYLSLYTASFSFLLSFIRARTAVPLVIAAPSVWVSLELLMTYFLTGFPWGLLGYSQHLNLPAIQIAEVTGVYGISFVIVMVNAGIFRAFEKRLEGLSFWNGRSLWAALLTVIITLGYGYWRIEQLSSQESGVRSQKINVGIVQGNIDQDHKWDSEYQKETVDAYLNLSRRVSEGGVDLVVWPETAVPLYFQDDEVYRPDIIKTAGEINSYLFFGSPAYSRDEDKVRYFNSAYLISPKMDVTGRYDKMHLVPFGEYIPLKVLFPFIDKLVEGIGDFSTGEDIKILDAGGAKIGTLICYEGVFPDLVRKSARDGANLLVNITNDAWFGNTSAPYQHLSMYSLRAVENRVPVVRAANTGISAFIDNKGAVVSSTGLFEKNFLKGQVESSDYKTFYAGFGDIFAYLCVMIACIALISALIRQQQIVNVDFEA